jgi:hypothetical protein
MITNGAGFGSAVDIKERDQITLKDIALVPTSSIEGRVLDEWGDPLPGVTVLAAQRVATPSQTILMTADPRNSAPTDDLGRFRCFGLMPGDYVLFVPTGPFAGTATSPTAPQVDGVSGFATTYFPGTERADNASAVHVAPGRDVRDVAFALVAVRTADVLGLLLDTAGQPAAGARVILLPTEDGGLRSTTMATTTTTADGSFVFRRVPAGTFMVQAFGRSEFGAAPGLVPSTADGAPDTRIRVELHPLRTARGRIVFEGSAPRPMPDGVRIAFTPTDFLSGPFGGIAIQSKISNDWAFEIPNLASTGLIRVIAPPGWLASHVWITGQDIVRGTYDFKSADVDGIEIVLTSHVGTVSGTVRDGVTPVAEAVVLIFTEVQIEPLILDDGLTVVHSNAQGGFGVPALLPGRYLAVATRLTVDALDPARIARLKSLATPFTVTDGGTTQLTLKLVTGGGVQPVQ